VIGEITNESNSADAFALLHIPWASGYAFGYVSFWKQAGVFDAILCVQGSDRWMAGKPSPPLSVHVLCANMDRPSLFPPMFDCGVLYNSWLFDNRLVSQ